MTPVRLRLGYASPLPPARSGIADYSADLLPALARAADVTLLVDDPAALDAPWRDNYPVAALSELGTHRWNQDLLLYHMGNSALHGEIYDALLRYPGLVVLHETNLHHFISDQTVGRRKDVAAYVREWAFAAGPAGLAQVQAIAERAAPTPFAAQPLNQRLLRSALGLVVHSENAAARLRTAAPDRPVFAIPMVAVPHPGHARRQELAWPDDSIIFATLGFLNPYKQIDLLLRAFARVHRDVPQARLLFVGEAAQGDAAFLAQIAALDLAAAVHYVGYVPTLSGFVDWIHTADVIVTLRHPTLGETSAGAIRALAAGRPQVVFDHGWYAELPTDAAQKVSPLDEDALTGALRDLALDPARRAAMGRAAAAHAAANHTPEAVAERYVAAARALLERLTA